MEKTMGRQVRSGDRVKTLVLTAVVAAMACAAALPGPGPVKKAVRFCIQVLRSFPALILALLATFFLGIGSFAGTAAIADCVSCEQAAIILQGFIPSSRQSAPDSVPISLPLGSRGGKRDLLIPSVSIILSDHSLRSPSSSWVVEAAESSA